MCVPAWGGQAYTIVVETQTLLSSQFYRRLEKRYQAVVLGKKMFFDLSGLYFAF